MVLAIWRLSAALAKAEIEQISTRNMPVWERNRDQIAALPLFAPLVVDRIHEYLLVNPQVRIAVQAGCATHALATAR